MHNEIEFLKDKDNHKEARTVTEEGRLVVRQREKLWIKSNEGASYFSSLSSRNMVHMLKEKREREGTREKR